MNLFRSIVVVCVVSLSSQIALAQDSPASPSPAQTARPPRGPRPAPTNLKVLPKTMTGDDVNKLMHQFEGDLGVECEFCHVRNPETKRNDFPSDANPVKETARAMIKMTDDLNAKYLAQLSNRKSTDPISCGTCHRGMSHPESFVPKRQERPRPPAAAEPSTPPPSA